MKTTIRKLIFLVVVFFISPLFQAAPSQACDISSFAQNSFNTRCIRIINLIEEAKLAVSLNTPDKAKRIGALFNDWIDFFLAHNDSGMPPTVNFISKDLWKKKLAGIGHSLKTLSNNNANDLEIERVKIFFENLTVPDALKAFHERAKEAKHSFSDTINFADDNWFTTVIKNPLEKAQNLLQPGYEHTKILEKDLSDLIEEYSRLKNYSKDFSKTDLEPLVLEFKKNCSTCLNKWNSFFMFE